MSAQFGNRSEFTRELVRRRREEPSAEAVAAAKRRSEADAAEYAACAKKVADLGLVVGSKFVYSYDGIPGNLRFCEVVEINLSARGEYAYLKFRVIASKEPYRGIKFLIRRIFAYVPIHIEGSPPFLEAIEDMQVIIDRQTAEDAEKLRLEEEKKAKRQQAEREKAAKETAKAEALANFRSAVQHKGFSVGGRAIGPQGPGTIHAINEEKFKVVLALDGKSGRKAFSVDELSWLVT